MPILTSAPSLLDNIITLALVAVLIIIVVIAVLCKAASKKKAANAPVAVEAPKVEIPAAPGSAGALKLHNVEPKTAAMLMAIVADKLGKPLNELRFISIKEVE